MPYTRSQARAEKERALKDVLSPLEKENNERLEYMRKLQKTVVVEDNPEKAKKWRLAHKSALSRCVNDENNVYRDPVLPIFEFFTLNEKIQETGNPWLLSDEGYSPSSYLLEFCEKCHVECLQAWRKWRLHVPRPE